MTIGDRHHTRLAALTLVMTAACATQPKRGVLSDHQVHVGQALPAVDLLCSDGQRRTIASRQQVQLVTFETLGDCQSCQAHIGGLIQLSAARQLPIPDIVVYWAPQSDVPAFLRLNAPTSDRPACRDSAGVFWSSPGISHTPVTIVLAHGNVVLIDDAPMMTPADQSRFLYDLRSAGAR